MKTSTARFISIAGHPFVLLPLLVFLPRFRADAPGALRTTAAFVVIAIVPLALLTWRATATGRWRTVDASDKANRPLLYFWAAVTIFASAAYFHFIEKSPSFARGCLIAGGMVAVAAALNRWVKISLHVAFACFCGMVLAAIRLAFGLPILLFVPLLIWSRLALSRHALSETLVGAALGLLTAAAVTWL